MQAVSPGDAGRLCKNRPLALQYIYHLTRFSVRLQVSAGLMLTVYANDSGSGSANGRYTCSRIFVNHRCFSGPYLNKGRIAELPQAIGPGKCTLVLKEVALSEPASG